tara:strand:+ start:312 stop:467 length:156 start_codon:yes stop_codon:yes gene_type:complete
MFVFWVSPFLLRDILKGNKSVFPQAEMDFWFILIGHLLQKNIIGIPGDLDF